MGFAIVFAGAGFAVKLHDPDAARCAMALDEIAARANDLAAFDLLREAPGALVGRVTIEASLEDAVRDAVLVQECAPEQVELKRALFAELARCAPADAILASASSALPASSSRPTSPAASAA